MTCVGNVCVHVRVCWQDIVFPSLFLPVFTGSGGLKHVPPVHAPIPPCIYVILYCFITVNTRFLPVPGTCLHIITGFLPTITHYLPNLTIV